MEFFIRQGSDLPILKMAAVRDGRDNSWEIFNEELINATIRFSMIEESTGIPKILMGNAYIVEKTAVDVDSVKDYYIYYKWDSRDTKRAGRFVGEFVIINSMGELIAPIREILYINII